MAAKPTPNNILQQAFDRVQDHDGNISEAARAMGIPPRTLQNRYNIALKRGVSKRSPEFVVPSLPHGGYSYDELKARQIEGFTRRHRADRARQWVPIQIKIPGPIALAFIGDPHVDDDGCNWPLLDRDTQIIVNTPGMFAGNLGDTQNNWVGRLIRLFAKQEMSHHQAWVMTEGWLREIMPKLLFLIRGNHDMWSGSSDPLDYIMRSAPSLEIGRAHV